MHHGGLDHWDKTRVTVGVVCVYVYSVLFMLECRAAQVRFGSCKVGAQIAGRHALAAIMRTMACSALCKCQQSRRTGAPCSHGLKQPLSHLCPDG